MNGKAISLTDYLEELKYAAGSGAVKISSSVVASGNLQAKTGITARVPGSALQSVLARSGQRSRSADSVNADRVPKIADHMAGEALRQGANLLSGKRQ